MALRSGEVAARAGVNLQTLRYYERRGILTEPVRSPGGHRLYGDDAVLLLQVVKAAQGLGFTLDEVAELVDAGSHAHRRRPHLATHTRTKLEQVRQKIAALQQIETTLQAVADAGCDDLMTCALEENCPIPFVGITKHEDQ
jgi:MerR family mercuric resistance operon transcriptional regulator